MRTNVEERARAARSALIDVIQQSNEGADTIAELVRVRQAFDLRERYHETLIIERSEPAPE